MTRFVSGTGAVPPAFRFSTSGADGLVADVFALPPAPAAGLVVPTAGDVVVGVVVSLVVGFVTPGVGPVVPGVFGPPAAPAPDAAPAGEVVVVGVVVADLFSGVSFVLGLVFGKSWPGGTPLGERFVDVDPLGAVF
jgi:hypothetical protein